MILTTRGSPVFVKNKGFLEVKRQNGRKEPMFRQFIPCHYTIYLRNGRLVSLVGKVLVYRAGGSGSIPGRTNTQGIKIIEVKVLPLL